MLFELSCLREESRFGTCEIRYNNISSLPSSAVSVKITDQDAVSINYELTPANNTIILPLETGDHYILETGDTRVDSVYNIRLLWSDNNVVYYSFMFNNTPCDKASNIILIDL
jgi:hypothetical protein